MEFVEHESDVIEFEVILKFFILHETSFLVENC